MSKVNTFAKQDNNAINAAALSSLPNHAKPSLDNNQLDKSLAIDEEHLILTDAAVNRIKSLLSAEDEAEQLKLRIFISGGGCSGFQYGFTFDEKINDDDTLVHKDGVDLLVDYMSLEYLRGAEVDYKSDANGEQFVIRNPNAKTNCGCGSSFGV